MYQGLLIADWAMTDSDAGLPERIQRILHGRVPESGLSVKRIDPQHSCFIHAENEAQPIPKQGRPVVAQQTVQRKPGFRLLGLDLSQLIIGCCVVVEVHNAVAVPAYLIKDGHSGLS